MIGDTLDGDIQGANNLGIKNVWINRKQIKKDQFLEKPSFEINTLEELDKILNDLQKNGEDIYNSKKDSIEYNFKKVEEYRIPEDWMYINYPFLFT